MRKIALALAAVIGMSSVAHADGYWPRHHHHNHGGCYNCNVYRGSGGDAGMALIGGLLIGGIIANQMQQPRYYEPACQTVFMGRQWNGYQWVEVYQRVCN
ncbi:hypothetical protein UFOVP247_182 [uncultured Caudovirales phage]|uniref:Uncharacterized protein n=1 Tax=uncultured Caudovirales phage TaxID=2100421 RepID=A0A6J7WU56_9CAUD|nr:hypothetical protein UFOVP247_182 [uncultured Caudovirales phage]